MMKLKCELILENQPSVIVPNGNYVIAGGKNLTQFKKAYRHINFSDITLTGNFSFDVLTFLDNDRYLILGRNLYNSQALLKATRYIKNNPCQYSYKNTVPIEYIKIYELSDFLPETATALQIDRKIECINSIQIYKQKIKNYKYIGLVDYRKPIHGNHKIVNIYGGYKRVAFDDDIVFILMNGNVKILPTLEVIDLLDLTKNFLEELSF